jgi:hypothetical protein
LRIVDVLCCFNLEVLHMRKVLLAISMAAVSGFAFAAQPGGVQATPTSIQATSGGVNIQGNTNINANSTGATATASGQSVARNVIGGIRGGTNIKGNTTISASAKGTTAVATGKSKAENMIGGIGGE